jgi:hypothetical protein
MSTPETVRVGMPELDYHASAGLSSTGMKWLLRSPKHYRQNMDHRVEKAAFDLGHCVHAKVLGVGMRVAVIPADVLSKSGTTGTDAARAFIADARAAGMVPVKADIAIKVDAIAEAVLANPKAAALLSLPGDVEVSLFADDPDTGVHLRGRIDYLGTFPDGRLVNIDLKTTTDVRRRKIVRAIEDFGYDVQSETYRHLLRLTDEHAAVAPTHLVFVETEPPHEVRVVQLAHPDWIDGGLHKMRRAIDIYAHCIATDTWPGDDDEPGDAEPIMPRPYYLESMDEEEMVI